MSQGAMKKIISDKIVSLFETNPERQFTANDVAKSFKSSTIDVETIKKHLLVAVSNGKIRLAGDVKPPQYIFVPPKYQEAFISLERPCHIVYDIIAKSGNNGIWRKEIKRQSKIDDKDMTKVLNILEQRALVKTIKSIHDKNVKMYMLFDITPSAEVTGGAWYQDGQFNTNLAESLILSIISHVQSREKLLMSELIAYVKESKNLAAHLNDSEVNQIIKAALYTRRIIEFEGYVRTGLKDLPTCPISLTPCCGCPVANMCQPGGPINPRECPYLQKMTELF